MTCAEFLHVAVYSAIAFVALTWGGNQACRLLLTWSGLISARTNPPAATAPVAPGPAPAQAPTPAAVPPPLQPRVGRLIGALERLLIAVGLLAGAWEVMAAVVALKTVARFKDLDQKLDAEYFLVGSLFSVAWAIAVTWLWVAYDQSFGLDISQTLPILASQKD
jgi:hypothetical protein